MNIKKIAVFLIILVICGMAISARAAEEDTRYFVKTNAAFWKKSFNARHIFDIGFTANLTAWQLRLAKLFGVEVEPVKKFNILEDSILAKAPKPTPVKQVPSDSIPWGIKMIYNDTSLDKTSGGADVNVAVLDTGVFNHLDLKDRIKECKDFTSPKLAMVDGKCEDKNGHGTHVAGIIAADGGSDGKGIYGVAPESNLFIYKVCSPSGTCWADDIAAAIKIAVEQGANIINLSLGSDSESKLVADAISNVADSGVLIVAAAGNDGPYAGSIDWPAADPKVAAVGAIDSSFKVPDWSARGVNSTDEPYVVEEKDIEFVAPGVNIESTWKDGGYVVLSGTSMAAPFVSGLAAKLWQKDAENPAEETRGVLHKLAKDILPPGDDDESGWGLPRL